MAAMGVTRRELYPSTRRSFDGETLLHRGLTRLRPPRRLRRWSSMTSDGDADNDTRTFADNRGIGLSSMIVPLPFISVDGENGGSLEKTSEVLKFRTRTFNRRPCSRLEPVRRRLHQAVKTAGVVGAIHQQITVVDHHLKNDLSANRKQSSTSSRVATDKKHHRIISLREVTPSTLNTASQTVSLLIKGNNSRVPSDNYSTVGCLDGSSDHDSSLPNDTKTCRKSLICKFRRHAKYLIVLRRLCDHHAARLRNYLDHSVNTRRIDDQMAELMFDKKIYKSGERTRTSPDFKRILSKARGSRNNDEIKYIVVALGNYPAFSTFPAAMKQEIAAKGWYEGHDGRRTIIKENDHARCVYFILSGEVAVSKMDQDTGKSETLCMLGRNDVFGELGIVNNTLRNASIISCHPVELLVFADQDYIEIFMYGGLHTVQNTLLRNLPFLDGWPVELLTVEKSRACINYFRRNTVLIHNSRYSDWIVVIKSGSCSVLKKLVHPRVARMQTSDTTSHGAAGTAGLGRSISGVAPSSEHGLVDTKSLSVIAPVSREITEISILSRPGTTVGRQETQEDMEKN